ncbi:hypothetical protein AGOR_G00117250 [Albula goreensis]|uniref:PWWP domain-containing protein n=1 Tax=Albula goreensis TaxID=1534307 RepID=A0A8T3DCR1_9TELE|nr:hypothetical protein AGOR_G00117250 [Albula goreensis]
MEAAAEELRAGSRIPVIIDQIVNDTLVVTLSYRERSYTGILLDSNRKTGLFCLPDVVTKQEESPAPRPCSATPDSECSSKPSSQMELRPRDENTLPEEVPTYSPAPVPTPVPAGQVPYPPYFEGAPFPQPLWVRHSYGQWVPQPPPRTIKRKKRRSREPGRMTMSTIRLRPRQVLCEKCKNTLNSDEDSKDGQTGGTKAAKKEDGDGKEVKRREEGPASYEAKKCKREKRDEEKFPGEAVVPHSPVIKISYSTPQGKGEVMKIPSRVHGSVKPFCPKQLAQNGLGEPERVREAQQDERTPAPESHGTCPAVSIPKLKLTRPLQSAHDTPSPKIRLKPRVAGEDSLSVYEAELVGGARRRSPRAQGPSLVAHSEDSAEKSSLEQSSASSGEEGEHHRHGDLTLLINFRKRKADSSSLSVCSSDSLDESKSFSSDGTSPELCDLAPGDDLSVSSSSSSTQDGGKTVPPLTVRLHTRSMTKCVTEEGHAVSVGDVVWGKIHGFPWWPARVLSISGRKEEQQQQRSREPMWPEATVSWFGSPTTSQLSVSKLSPFRDFFRSRFNRKKKGMYRRAIVEAAKAVGHMSPEITTLLSHCET